MSVELTPVGMKCQLACDYCYENPMRDAGNLSAGYDLNAMKSALLAEGQRFTLFGGEPMLMPPADFEDMLRWGFERFGGTSLQTNGALITLDHVDLFQRYNTAVGVSIDGPDDLNDVRRAATPEKTRAATAATLRAIDLLCASGRPPSLIVTLHRGNATADRLPRLLDWLVGLDRRGLQSARIHLLEVDHAAVRDQWKLTDDENVAALQALLLLERHTLKALRFDLFDEMAKLLLATDGGCCVWTGCDPLTTPAVRGIDGLGQSTNCNRTNKDGVNWLKADAPGNERYLVLHATPQADGGCHDCRFFYACKGQCPGTAIGGDWRNRSDQCRVWFRLFEQIETELRLDGQAPVSVDPARRHAAEQAVLGATGAGQSHGDHYDAPEGYQHADGYYTVHGDHGTTDMHGDHDDIA